MGYVSAWVALSLMRAESKKRKYYQPVYLPVLFKAQHKKTLLKI